MEEKLFDLKRITEDDIYLGEICIVTKIKRDVLEEIKKCDIILGDHSLACNFDVAKKNVIFIKVSHNQFVDLDTIKCKSDIDKINNLLLTKSKDNNILLRQGTFNPFVGQLYIQKLRWVGKKYEGEVQLKLKNTLK